MSSPTEEYLLANGNKFSTNFKNLSSQLKGKFTEIISSIGNNNNNQNFDSDSDEMPDIEINEPYRRTYGSFNLPEIRLSNENFQGSSKILHSNSNDEEIPLLVNPSSTNFVQQHSLAIPPPQYSYQNHNEQNRSRRNSFRKLSTGSATGNTGINLYPEQDLKFLTVDFNNDRLPGSSGFVSGASSPHPTIMSSFEFPAHDTWKPEKFTYPRMIKVGVLVIVFLIIAALITSTSENAFEFKQISVNQNRSVYYPLKLYPPLKKSFPIMTVIARGAFLSKENQKEEFTTHRLIVDIHKLTEDWEYSEPVTESWELAFYSQSVIRSVPERTFTHGFNLENLDWTNGTYIIQFKTNTESNFPFAVSLSFLSEAAEMGPVFGGLVLLGLYILVIFELVNRTLSAILAAAASIGILSMINERPTTMEMVSWLDMETLILLFSMMVIVAILGETGFFDYSAYFMYKITNGAVWPLITGLCLFVLVVSAFLDNVTTILLMTPVTIRICEAMALNPVPVLISIVIFSNIGGAITPVGDPPNVIIGNNPKVIEAGIDFPEFMMHMFIGIVPVALLAYAQIRFIFRDMKSLQFSENYIITELKREIDVWTRTASSMNSYSKEESHVKQLLNVKVEKLKHKLKLKMKMGGQSVETYKANLVELEAACKIRDWSLLIKSGIVLIVVVILFFLHSIPQLNLSLGWTALLGAVLLLILADNRELEGIFSRVEWSTLIFFSALFIVMEGISRLGLLEWIGEQTEQIILGVDPESRLTVAILLILWVSGIASAFIDNIPFTTMMIQIVTRISENLDLPLQPLVWSLAFGTCLGGNGTLIGASANVVCAGLADQHGYKFSFMEYFKIGFPVTIVSLAVSTVYLVICHTILEWND